MLTDVSANGYGKRQPESLRIRIIMKPVPDKRLGFMKAEYKSAAGLIQSEWKYEGDKWIWKFSIPEGATATVTLPGETEAKIYTAGTYNIDKDL